ncbi:MAG: DNA topoisomerase IV [Lentisphaerae bacterium RIFOXYC12_FULL_60_16]|nr:MAG: DNA topoisomerase IV [Lentisphaerae bacterium RIFOXYC12_FULL_60_16]OGV74673.1 MAG: DNA topoisomerase IV [Lentisphaerae bacterium RIFOXYA12_FULL_60_10]OGV78509.1 MAG: DNA topoisomerase IV [Lentisphaerae bacterium RIFOXYB12_FULL_60_10]
MKTDRHLYDESKVKTLSSLEHIRLRPGMYIGRIGDGSRYEDGIYILLKEVVDNSVDEFIMGHGSTVEVQIENRTVSVRDFGRGIPLGKVVECVSQINTGAKYNDDVFQFSVGLNGVGTKAVNALSETFTVSSYREGRHVTASFRKGVLDKPSQGKTMEPDGTRVVFTPDHALFEKAGFVAEHVTRRLRLYTFLHAGLTLRYNGTSWMSQGGLADLVREESRFEKRYAPFHHREKTLELAFTHTNRFNEQYLSFVNGQHTVDGGTHESAFKEGLLKGINAFFRTSYEGDEVREGLVGAIAIRLRNPVFESQTKHKLGNTEIRAELVGQVKEIVTALLHRNPQTARALQTKIEETHSLRQEIQAMQKASRERARSVTIRVPQLKDCKVHLNREAGTGKESMLFIVEGLSAAGSLTSCRDPHTQAVFTLKGKPLNVCDLGRDALYKNTELYNLMRSLDVEDSVERLRYGRVIIATDADVDGLHIRNLLITYFLRFFEPLVREGFLHVLETPLFRVRDKRRTVYCYSEAERDTAVTEFGRNVEITRFKGLGEISPGEFKAFIGTAMRLAPVSVEGEYSIPELLGFYMGHNTAERRQYIMNHLVVEPGA